MKIVGERKTENLNEKKEDINDKKKMKIVKERKTENLNEKEENNNDRKKKKKDP